MLAPVLAEPVDLLFSEVELQRPAIEARVLRERRELAVDVDPQGGGIDGEHLAAAE